ncbi:bifunctional tRNA pseudouridine(32) synthase/23S rRNA pseudouridine(746) synthase RluA [Aggregatibacter actinomycetemcomitans]|uniref:bifunctional tRNA pseudouridine(32) synthase/23S rRNA pseudouridine(746) synthase RluA n=1 Tax=Aggregatibacter actinomycetemcomitans TaxID=714 RepID=UPI00022ADDCF|nr:bifunctional tRNA pseudouridine(32) synthase/23S rRNA pseudouridine(746) synthase RluA [Aggregatibacter actinomycetemcomitans]KOE64657.1 23S rRNA pseudouridylate synthase [Aggregatibacter actinomycetemcomitans serotype e str. A160]KOE65397.1 23S rRNA pseudouridylate synthase [Aggregatibacter actinomycetemcomitans serotype e str. SCC393]KOE68969.1 23S rRNA pseudouridylate synthase [Aggregatibacter actinomycetemcomitans serotype f str. D18P1]KYK80130.1 23S rRNA/tRNA pseudouridine synthase A [A
MALIEYNPPQESWLDLVYRDDYIAVVNKPSGLLSVPGNQPQYYDSAMSRVKEKYGFCEPAHRLDMATSGILLFALSKSADRELKRQFREREPKKYYQALVWGHLEQEQGVVELPLICDWENRPRQKICFERGKRAVTFYEVLQRYPNNTTRIKLTPITGRSHQLRLHMLALGHPILGDKFYAHPQAKALSPRLCLHAESLQIRHPITGETMEFTTPVGF